jgi:hypothetical protein
MGMISPSSRWRREATPILGGGGAAADKVVMTLSSLAQAIRAVIIGVALLVAIVASGCQNRFSDTGYALLSQSDCVAGWNHGRVAWRLRPPWVATRRIGFISRRVWITPEGQTDCWLGFHLGGGRVAVLEGGGVYNADDAVRHGLIWSPVAGLATLTTLAQYQGGQQSWIGCQTDTGEVRIGNDCGPHDPAVIPFPVEQAMKRPARPTT